MAKTGELNKLKITTIKEIELLGMEFEQILEKTKKSKSKGLFKDIDLVFSDEDLEDLYKKRKDRKYAALTIELYAIVEQFWKSIYFLYFKEEDYNKPDNVNAILYIQRELKEKIKFINFIDNTNITKTLADLRNYIIHDTFSFKQARKKFNLNNKSSELYPILLEKITTYIGNIKVR